MFCPIDKRRIGQEKEGILEAQTCPSVFLLWGNRAVFNYQGQVSPLAGWGQRGELGQGWCWQPYWPDSLLGSTRIPFLKLISKGHSLRGTRAGGGESHLSWAVAFHLTCRMAGLSLTQDVAGNISTRLRWEMSKEQGFCSFPFCSSCPHGRGSEMSWKKNRLWIQKRDSVIYHPNYLFPVCKKELGCQQYL